MTVTVRQLFAAAAFSLFVFVFGCGAARADALDDIRARGALTCAISDDEDDFSLFDAHGDLSRLGADLCRAVAATIFPGPAKTTMIATGDEITAMRAVRDRRADIAFGTTPDPALAAQLPVSYAPPFLIDGQGFLVNSGTGVRDAAGLAGRTVCFIEGSPGAQTIRTAMTERGIAFTAFPFAERGEMMGALATGHCGAVTGDLTELAAERLSLPALARHAIILPDRITVDPWSPVVRSGEGRLLQVVSALEDGLVTAAVLGIGRQNAATDAARPADPVVARLLGDGTWEARGLDLDERFILRAIEAVGNQAELYRRDVGDGSPFRLPVGPNAPVERGGALLSIPVAPER